jgi:nucleotide-binding universal stress UspA family protein
MAQMDVDAKRVCNILVPVDGSENSAHAVQLAIRLHAKLAPLAVHLLHVQVPPGPIVDKSASLQSAEAPARAALAAAKTLLDAAAVPCTSEIASGYVGLTIVAYARERGCDGIVMGTRGVGSTEQLLGSIARQVVQLADMPVTLVK